jgi:hypothetical protein
MTLQLLRPGESSLVDFSVSATFEYPLDSILVVPHQPEQLQYVARAVGYARRAPWMPVLIGSGQIGVSARDLDELVSGLSIATFPFVLGARADAAGVRGAVRGRAAPSIGGLAKWCALRLDWEMDPVLRKVLNRGQLSRREVTQLYRFSGLSTLGWRALFTLVQLHADAWCTGLSLEHLAERFGTSRKTVWDWTGRLLDLSWRRMQPIAAWESIVELALRRSGAASTAQPRLARESVPSRL